MKDEVYTRRRLFLEKLTLCLLCFICFTWTLSESPSSCGCFRLCLLKRFCMNDVPSEMALREKVWKVRGVEKSRDFSIWGARNNFGPKSAIKKYATLTSRRKRAKTVTATASWEGKFGKDVCPTRTATRPDEGIAAKMIVSDTYECWPQQAQCRIFSTTYNPEGLRLGNKILRQRLRGPALAAYYPRKMATVQDLMKAYAPDFVTYDEEQEDRLEKIKMYAPFDALHVGHLLTSV